MLEAVGLDALVADLTAAPGRAQRGAYDVVRVGGANVTKTARQFASGLAHARLYPASITYDVTIERGAFDAEIGPDKDLPQGALGNLLEYGSVNNGPIAHLGPALDLEGPNMAAALSRLGAPW